MTADATSVSRVKRILPWLVAVAFFMESLDTTILNTAVPIVARALAISPLDMKSVLASYTLSLAVFIPVSGWMADRFGTRRVFSAAIATFTLGSLLCGLSPNVDIMIACRILQGCGGAMMVPVGRLTLVRTFPKFELVRAMSFVVIPSLVGPMLGPVVGGVLVNFFPWRSIFFLNIPIGVAGLIVVYLHLPDYREPELRPLDVAGLILFGCGIATLSYVLEIFGEDRLGVGETAGLVAISVALLAGYGFHAKTVASPLLQPGLFRIRSFATAVIGSFVTRIAAGGVPFLLSLLYQEGLGYSPVQSGLLAIPQALAALGTKFFVPRLLARLGYRKVLVYNTIAMGGMLMLFATIGIGTPVSLIVLQTFCYGALTSAQYTSMITLVYADVSADKASNASSIASTLQQLSMSFGVAAAGLTTMFFLPEHQSMLSGSMIGGLHRAFLVLGLFTIISTLIFSRLRQSDGADEMHRSNIRLTGR